MHAYMNIYSTIEPVYRHRAVVAVCDEQKQIIANVHISFAAANLTEAKNAAYHIANRRYPNGVYFHCRELEQISRHPISTLHEVEIFN